MKRTLLLSFLFIIPQAKALTTVSASLAGTIDVELKIEKHFRHSLDCDRDPRGPETWDIDPVTLNLQGGLQGGNLGTYVWNSAMMSPFYRHIRNVVLTTTSTQNGLAEEINLNLADQYQNDGQQFDSGKCWHKNGHSKPIQAQIEGQIKLTYTVPKNIWAVRVSRTGKGLLAKDSMKPMRGVLNNGFDRSVMAEEIFWVKPGSQITQEFVIKRNTPGNADLGESKITFTPLAENLSSDDAQRKALLIFKDYKNTLDKKSPSVSEIEKKSEEFIKNAMGLILYYDNFSTVPSRIPTQEMLSISKSLFDIANAVIPSPKLGLPVKTAAALASFEIAMRLLTDLSKYCDMVEVHLPMKNQTVKVLGLRAANFWLTRGLAGIKNYRFKEYEAFVEQLAILEANRITYADVVQDKNSWKQIHKAYNFLTETIETGGSPFRAALKDLQRNLKQFGAIGSNDVDTEALVKSLNELSRTEEKFVRELFASMEAFDVDSREIVKGQDFLNQLKVLKDAQNKIADNMENNIRLLSAGGADSGAVMNTMHTLLSNQIAIFDKELKIDYFETLRSEYFRNNGRIGTIEKSKMCVTGGT